MLLNIIHHTRYRYSLPVFLEPFTVRLRPRSDATQTLRSYRIDVTPVPSGMTHCLDLEGNDTETIWFSELHESLSIEVNTLVETHHGNPFDFLITDPGALNLPVKYQPHVKEALAHYLVRDANCSEVTLLAKNIAHASEHQTILFLSNLAEEIYSQLKYELREQGDPWTPEETMKRGTGSCRDFAILFVDICRSVGVAARFVSGYCIGDTAANSHDMHAWAEVYLPGAGWRGFDPSRGLLVSDDYVAVAAGLRAQDAAPTFGSFRGKAVSTMETQLSLRVMEEEAATG